MDAIVNFGGLLERSSPRYDMAQVPNTGLYSTPIRRSVPIVLAIIVVYNSVMVILCGIVTAGIDYGFPDPTSNNEPIGSSATPSLPYRLYETQRPYGKRFHADYEPRIMFFYWCTIPLFALFNSLLELIKRRRRTLRPLHITIMASIIFCTWVCAIPLWTSCAFSEGGEVEYAEYCLVSFTKSGPSSSWSGVLDLAWYLPWLVIPGIVLYIIYLVFGAIALHRERKHRRKSTVSIPDEHEMGRTPSTELLTSVSQTRPPSYRELATDSRQSKEVAMPKPYQTVFTEELELR